MTENAERRVTQILQTAGGVILAVTTALVGWVVAQVGDLTTKEGQLRERMRGVEVRTDGVAGTLESIHKALERLTVAIDDNRKERQTELGELRRVLEALKK
jgi:hypothetical protein